MSLRLLLALAVSIALHASLLAPRLFASHRAAPQRVALRAQLRPPPAPLPPPAAPAIPAEPLLKNTLDADTKPAEPAAPQLKSPPKPAARASAKTDTPSVRAAQRKLSKYEFYPPEALARGLEGKVGLLIRWKPDGTIEEISVAASSGHAILDKAAIKAAYAMGRQPAGGPREEIVWVDFHLQKH